MHGHLMQGREDAYTYQLTTQDVAELTAAVAKVKSTGVSTEKDILKVRTTLALHTAQPYNATCRLCITHAYSLHVSLHSFIYLCPLGCCKCMA